MSVPGVRMYIAISENLVEKYCGSEKLCFWAEVALLSPHGSRDLYVFDCSMYQHVKAEYRDKPDCRMLLTFKLPIKADELAYTGEMGFHVLRGPGACDQDEISRYIASVFKHLDEKIEEAGRELAELSYQRESLRRLLPLPRGDRAVLRGVYYGLKVRRDILMDIASRLGYAKNSLNANVKSGYVLISLDPGREKYTALTLNKKTELKAYSRLLDKSSLLNAISLRYNTGV